MHNSGQNCSIEHQPGGNGRVLIVTAHLKRLAETFSRGLSTGGLMVPRLEANGPGGGGGGGGGRDFSESY